MGTSGTFVNFRTGPRCHWGREEHKVLCNTILGMDGLHCTGRQWVHKEIMDYCEAQ